MKPDCLFCTIAHHDKEKLVWENEFAAAFNDIHPAASTHVLIVPKQHVDSLQGLDDEKLMVELVKAIQAIVRHFKLEGYKVRINVGRSGGQVVDHLHIHVLGGKFFSEKIG